MSRYRVRVEFETRSEIDAGRVCAQAFQDRFACMDVVGELVEVVVEPLPEPLSAEEFVEKVRDMPPEHMGVQIPGLLRDYDRGREGTR